MTDTFQLPKQPKAVRSLVEKIESLIELADVKATLEVRDAVDAKLKIKVATQKENLKTQIEDLDKIETK